VLAKINALARTLANARKDYSIPLQVFNLNMKKLYHAIENTANQNTRKPLYFRRYYIQPSHHAPRIPGGGLTYKKDGGARRKPLRGTKILFVGVAWIFFLSLLGTNSNLTKLKISWFSNISCHIFSAQWSKRYRKSSRWGPFEPEHPERYKNRFLNPYTVRTAPLSFLYMSPPGAHMSHWLCL